MNDFLDKQGFALYHKKITEYINKKDSEVMNSAGKVSDVIMNGKTIVVDKIANIDNSITAEYIIGRIGIAPVGRAKADKDGNVIDETYATIDSLRQVEAIAIGRSKSSGAENLVKLQEFLNSNYDSIEFKFGDNIFIVALDEPDLWCYGTNDITEDQNLTKEQMIEALGTVEGLKLKGYTFHKLETQKVDLSNYVEKEEGKGLSENDFTDELKAAYDDHILSEHASADAEKNQNAFSSVAIDGQPTVNADNPTSTLTIKAGKRVSLASDSDGKTVTINANTDDIKIKNIESSGAAVTITFMDGSSIGFELETSETDLVDPDDIIVGKANDASLLGGRDGSHYLDYNNHTNAPIVNANLSDFIEPAAGTYYRNVGLTDDTFISGVIYYYDGSDYHPVPYSNQSKDRCVHYVDKDVFSVEQGASNLSMKWALDDIDGITEPFAGMMASIQIPDTSSYGSGIVMSIDGGATYHPVLRNRVTALTNAYQEDVIVTFIYNPDLSAQVYLSAGVKTTIDGCWQVADYDSDRLVQQSSSTSDMNLPVLLKVNESDTTATGNVLFNPDITVNPKTGVFNAPQIYQDGVPINDLFGSGANGMPIIRLVAVSDMDRTGVISPDNPLRVTIEVISGAILPTDKIELCSRKAFVYKKYDLGETDAGEPTRIKGRRWRLRKIAERAARYCRPDKSFANGQYRMICWDKGNEIIPRAFLRSDNEYTARKWVTKYVRVSRLDDAGTTFHSNAVEFSFSIDSLERPYKNTAKINIK